MLDMAAARRADVMDISYQYKLSKGAPRDVAYEKLGPMIRDTIWSELDRGEQREKAKSISKPQPRRTPHRDGPDLDRD